MTPTGGGEKRSARARRNRSPSPTRTTARRGQHDQSDDAFRDVLRLRGRRPSPGIARSGPYPRHRARLGDAFRKVDQRSSPGFRPRFLENLALRRPPATSVPPRRELDELVRSRGRDAQASTPPLPRAYVIASSKARSRDHHVAQELLRRLDIRRARCSTRVLQQPLPRRQRERGVVRAERRLERLVALHALAAGVQRLALRQQRGRRRGRRAAAPSRAGRAAGRRGRRRGRRTPTNERGTTAKRRSVAIARRGGTRTTSRGRDVRAAPVAGRPPRRRTSETANITRNVQRLHVMLRARRTWCGR